MGILVTNSGRGGDLHESTYIKGAQDKFQDNFGTFKRISLRNRSEQA